MTLILIIAISLIGLTGITFIIWGVHQYSNQNYQTATITINDQVFTVQIAESMAQKSKGLSGRDNLAPNTGMLFTYSTPHQPVFWMKGMNFPIDIIWLNNNQIVDLTSDLQPATLTQIKTYKPKVPANQVLEVPAGTIAKHNFQLDTPVIIKFK